MRSDRTGSLKIYRVAASIFVVCFLSGCSSSGSLNGAGSLAASGSDRPACEKYAEIPDAVGEAISVDGSNALEYAAAIEREALPLANGRLAVAMRTMSSTLRKLADASLLEQVKYSDDLLTSGNEIAEICVVAMLDE